MVNRVSFPSFREEGFSSNEMRQFVSAVEFRFQQLELESESFFPEVEQGEFAPFTHTHTESEITDLQHIESIFDLNDVTGTPIIGDLLVWDGDDFVPMAPADSGGVSVLNDLDDVNALGPADLQVLTWDAGSLRWTAQDASASASPDSLVTLTDTDMTGQGLGDMFFNADGAEWQPSGPEMRWTPGVGLAYGTDITLSWYDADTVLIELVAFSGAAGTPATVGPAISYAGFWTLTDSAETGTSYADTANGLDEPITTFTDGAEVLVVSHAMLYNNSSSSASGNGFRIVANDVEVLGSETLREGRGVASSNRGDLYSFAGWFTAGTTGNVNSQLKLGTAGTEYVSTSESHFLLDLSLIPNHQKDRSTTPVTTTGTSWINTGASVTLTSDDWIVYMSGAMDNSVGTVQMDFGYNDGASNVVVGSTQIQDSSDALNTCGGILLENFSGTLTTRARTAGNNGDSIYAAIIAIPLSDFAQAWSIQHDDTEEFLAAQSTEEVMNNITVASIPVTTNYIGLQWSKNPGTSATGISIGWDFTKDVNGAGVTSAGYAATSFAHGGASATTASVPMNLVSDTFALIEGESFELNQVARTDRTDWATRGPRDHGMVLLQMNGLEIPAVPGDQEFTLGDELYAMELDALDVRMNSDIAFSWYDAGGTLSEFLELDSVTTVDLATNVTSFQTTTESSETDQVTFQDTTNGLDQVQSAFTDGDEILIVATSLLYNNNSSGATENGYRVAVDGTALAGSEMLCEGTGATSSNDGNPYNYVGWFTADTAAGNVTTQLLLGSGGTSYNCTSEISILLNLTESVPNHQKANAHSVASPLDITDTTTPQLTGANVTVVAGDWLVFCCTQTGNHNGAASPEVGLNDGSTYYSLSGNRVTDSAGDQHVCGGAYFLEDYAGGTLSTTVMVNGSSVNGDCTYASIVAIPMADFANWWATQNDETELGFTTQSVAEDVNTLSIASIPTSTNYLAIGWTNTEMSGTSAIPGFQINEDVNGGGVTKIGHDQTYSGRKFTSTAWIGQTTFSSLRPYIVGDAVEITQSGITDDPTPANKLYRNAGLILIEMTGNSETTTGFIVGDPSYSTTIDGLSTNITSASTDIDGTLNVDGAVTLASTLDVTGIVGFNTDVGVNGGTFTITGPTLANNGAWSHDDTDLTTTFVNTVDWNITGLTGNVITDSGFRVVGPTITEHATFETRDNSTDNPKAAFSSGSSAGDAISSAGFTFGPDITTGEKRTTLEVIVEKTLSATSDRFGFWLDTTIARLFSSDGTAGGAGQDIGITTQGVASTDYDIFIDATTRDVTIGNFPLDGDQTVGAGQDNFVLTYDDGTGLIGLEATGTSGQTPWVADIDGAAFALTNVNRVDIWGDILVADPPVDEQVTASLNLYDSDGSTIIGSFGHQGNATPALEIRNYFPQGPDGSITMYADKSYIDAGEYSHRFSNSYMRIQSAVVPSTAPAAGGMDICTFDMSQRDGAIQTRIQNDSSVDQWLFQNNVENSDFTISLHNTGGDVEALRIDPTTGTLLADFGTFSVAMDALDTTGRIITSSATASSARISVENTGASSTTGGGGVRVQHDDGAAMGSGDRLGLFGFGGAWDGSNDISYTSQIAAYATELWDVSGRGSDIQFRVTPNNSTTLATYMTLTDTELTVVGGVDAADFNGVALTTAGASSSYLDETGVYSIPAGAGDVVKVGTPLDDQIGVWTGDGTIEGTTAFTKTATQFTAGNYIFNIDETVGAGQDDFVLTYDNGTGEIGLEAAGGGGGVATPLDIIGDINMATPPIEAAFTGLLRIMDNDETDLVGSFGYEGAGALILRNHVQNANMDFYVDDFSDNQNLTMRLDGGRTTEDYRQRPTALFDTIKCGTTNTISFSPEDPPFSVIDESFVTGETSGRIVMWGSGHIQYYSTGLTANTLRINNDGGLVNIGGADQVTLGHDGSQSASTTTRANGGFQAWNNATGGNALERVLTTSDLFRTSTFTWKFETSTTGSDPGTGDMRFNNSTPASVTELYFDSFLDDVDGIDRTVDGVLGTLEAGDRIYCQNDYDISEYFVFEVTSATDNTGWWTIGVTAENVGGLPATGVILSFVFVKGITGVQKTESVTATNVITAAESGTTFYLNAVGGFTSTLPVPAAGLNYKFIVATAPTTAYIVTTNAGANLFEGTLIDIVGELQSVAAQDTINFVASTSLVGDRLEVESDGTNWYCKAISKADGGMTFSVT